MIASVAVVTFRNPIYGVLSLIIAFVNAAGLFLLAQAEFLALALIVVYVGAVVVLFLFLVMMFDIKRSQGPLSSSYRWASVCLIALIFFELISIVWVWHYKNPGADFVSHAPPLLASNTQALGGILYTSYFFIFQIAGLILLVAMIGAIVLCLWPAPRKFLKVQNIQEQLLRTKENSLEIRTVPFGRGVDL